MVVARCEATLPAGETRELPADGLPESAYREGLTAPEQTTDAEYEVVGEDGAE